MKSHWTMWWRINTEDTKKINWLKYFPSFLFSIKNHSHPINLTHTFHVCPVFSWHTTSAASCSSVCLTTSNHKWQLCQQTSQYNGCNRMKIPILLIDTFDHFEINLDITNETNCYMLTSPPYHISFTNVLYTTVYYL